MDDRSRATSRSRILVVEDDPLGLELMQEYLSQGHYEVVTAEDGEQAWRLLGQPHVRFDVVLTDRIMPRLNGIELLKRIKANPDTAYLPVIMVTSAGDPRDVIEGVSAGAFYYLTKPIDGEVLRSMVRAALSDHERYRELLRQVRSDVGMLRLMRRAEFTFRTPDEATELGPFLAKACPDPERVVMGLSELLINAVEHGNLEITYQEKTRLNSDRAWRDEIRRRLELPGMRDRRAAVRFERGGDGISITIQDEGPGFDPAPFLRIDPSRVFDSHGRGIAIANLLSFDRLEYHDNGRRVVGRLDLDGDPGDDGSA